MASYQEADKGMRESELSRRSLLERGLWAGVGVAGFALLPGKLDLARQLPGTPDPISGFLTVTGGGKRHAVFNNLPARNQWQNNYGYCGEVSMIMGGLYFGQYVSQYDARAIASKGAPQNRESSQLFVGVNDTFAAAQMRLSAAEWDNSSEQSTSSFLAWVKQNVVQGHPVAIGIFMNQYLFQDSSSPSSGDPDYDHIVVATGIGSDHALTDPAYYADDIIYFSDNGCWPVTGAPVYGFAYSFGSFQKDREQANAHDGPIYSLSNNGSNYGIAFTGVADLDKETLPVWVGTSVNYEDPVINDGATARPKPMSLTLDVRVSGLRPGTEYRLYRYGSFGSLPVSAFNAHASDAQMAWDIEASSEDFTLSQQIMSDEVVAYRAVARSAS
jgi:hypothetical protein